MTTKLSKLALGVGLIAAPSVGVVNAATTVNIDSDEQVSSQRPAETETQVDFRVLVLNGKDGRTGKDNGTCVTDNGCRSCTFVD